MATRRSQGKKRKSDDGGRQDEDDDDEEVVDKDARVRSLEEASALLQEHTSSSEDSVVDLTTQTDELGSGKKQAFCALYVASTGVSSEVASVAAGVKLVSSPRTLTLWYWEH